MDFPRRTPEVKEHGPENASARPPGKAGLVLAAIAIGLVLALAIFLTRSIGRLERQVGRLTQQTAGLAHQVVQAQEQSQTLAKKASEAAANAEAAANERDLAKQAQEESAAQTQVAQQQAETAQQQAAAAQQQADQAKQLAAQYRQQREADLAQLQQALSQIVQTRRTAMGLVMTLDSNSIHFDFDKAVIKPQYRDILNRIAGILMALKGYSISIYGYTDDIGTQAYNLKLSKRRAQAVRDFLVEAGIPASIITTKGFGESDPRVPGNSEQARAANRRVEIGIVDSTLLFGSRAILQK